MVFFIGVTGSDSGAMRTFAREFVQASKDKTKWAIVSIDDIVKMTISDVLSNMTKEVPVLRNDYFIRTFRDAMTKIGDDFWVAVTVKHINDMATLGYENFIITDDVYRGEHNTIREVMGGRMIYVNNGAINTHCTYPTELVEFDVYVEFKDVGDLRERIQEIVKVTIEGLEDKEPVTYIGEDGEELEVKPLDDIDEAVMYT